MAELMSEVAIPQCLLFSPVLSGVLLSLHITIGMMVLTWIKASGFWGGWFQSPCDVRIFNPYAPLNQSNLHECAKRQEYEIWRVSLWNWTHTFQSSCVLHLWRHAWVPPLQLHISVWPSNSFCLLSGWPLAYCKMMNWLHCCLGFSLSVDAYINHPVESITN